MVCFWMTRDKTTREKGKESEVEYKSTTSAISGSGTGTTPDSLPQTPATVESDAPQSSNASTIVLDPAQTPLSVYTVTKENNAST